MRDHPPRRCGERDRGGRRSARAELRTELAALPRPQDRGRDRRARREIDRVLRRVDLDRLQFHGDETEEQVESVDLPVIKAIRGADPEAAEQYPGTMLLLDHPTEGGGRGKPWKWSDAAALIETGCDVILAGGLDPDNVGGAIADLGDLLPWGVDVASGVEGAAHRKDAEKIKRFVLAVRAAEAPPKTDEPK
ncbi:MAG: hypothetical protein E6J87_00090 [Deltaproteobacteria bacterium]|nr:MAG: hypothetical protein E6J87_00090 [Deltaproteobacteria bacterium]